MINIMEGFNDFMNKGKVFYENIGMIGLYKKDDRFTVFLLKRTLNFNQVIVNNKIYNIEGMLLDNEAEAIMVQQFVHDNLEKLIVWEVEAKLKKLKEFLKMSRILPAMLMIADTKMFLKKDLVKKDLVKKDVQYVLKHIVNIDNYQDNFYEFFNVIAAGSSTPMVDVFDPIIFLLKIKLEKSFGFNGDIMDVFWEYNDAVRNGTSYVLDFSQDGKEISREMKSIPEFVDIMFEFFLEENSEIKM
jgi:hypothetical protein